LADKIRDELSENGITIKDKDNKTEWEYKWAKKKYIFLTQH
jgi:cysteinyl-tRNA synthetase